MTVCSSSGSVSGMAASLARWRLFLSCRDHAPRRRKRQAAAHGSVL
jgi:hypothetical protein